MNMEDIGQLVRRRRKVLGVKQDAAAELAGVSVHTLSNIESGRGNPTFQVLDQVLRVLGLEIVVQVESTP